MSLKDFDIQVCLVSEQAIPNFFPILEYRPKEVFLIVTERMKTKANLLEDKIRQRTQAKVEQIHIASEFNMPEVEEHLLELLEKSDGKKIALNLTGGTKLMSFAAMNLFRDLGADMFYVTPENKIYWFEKGKTGQGNIIPTDTLKVSVEDMMFLHGYKVLPDETNKTFHKDWLPFAKELVQFPSMANALSSLNKAISESIDTNKKSVQIVLPHDPDHALGQVLSTAENCGLLTWKGKQITFDSIEARDYVAGGWFEEYVFDIVNGLDEMQGCAMSVQIDLQDKKNGKRNELDVVFVAKNKLFIIECKTRNFLSEKLTDEQKNEVIYKLQTLGELGGKETKTALVSLRETESFMRTRAEGGKVALWEKDQIKGLKKLLQTWINK